MSDKVNTQNISALNDALTALTQKVFELERKMLVNSNAVGTVNGQIENLNSLIHRSLIKKYGAGSTEVDNGD